MKTLFLIGNNGSSDPYNQAVFTAVSEGPMVYRSTVALVTEVQEGSDVVRERTVFKENEQSKLDEMISNFKGDVVVHRASGDADYRGANSLPSNVAFEDLSYLTKWKNDDELSKLRRMSQTLASVSLDSETTFRSTLQDSDYVAAYDRTEFTGFTEYRSSLCADDRLYVEATKIVGKTPEWRGLTERVEAGFDGAQKHIIAGTNVADAERIFRSHLDPEDVVYGNLFCHTGNSPHGADPVKLGTEFEEGTALRMGVVVECNDERAMMFRGTFIVGDEVYRSVMPERDVEEQRKELAKAVRNALSDMGFVEDIKGTAIKELTAIMEGAQKLQQTPDGPFKQSLVKQLQVKLEEKQSQSDQNQMKWIMSILADAAIGLAVPELSATASKFVMMNMGIK